MIKKLLSFPTFFFLFILAAIIDELKLAQLIFQANYEPWADIPIGHSPAYRPVQTTYAFSPDHMITYITKTEIQNAFQKAFGRWSAVIPVTFREVDDYESANISIGWYDGVPFDGVSGILALTSLSDDWRHTIHLDAAETWAVADQYKGWRALWRLWPRMVRNMSLAYDLESVAVHEIGHVLWLGHSKVKESVMYPDNKPWRKKVELAVDDVERVQAIYGSNPNYFRIDYARSGGGVIRWWASSIWTRMGVLLGLSCCWLYYVM